MATPELQRQINKRLTLNVLIQGAAVHCFLTAHHLVRDELEKVRPGLTKLYDRAVLALQMNHFYGDWFLFAGLPRWFWWSLRWKTHPFCACPLLANYGGELSRSAKRTFRRQALRKGILGFPVISTLQMLAYIVLLNLMEWWHQEKLNRLAVKVTSEVWGISESQFDAEIAGCLCPCFQRPPKTPAGRMLLQPGSICGYSFVKHREDDYRIFARAWNFPVLVHELIKGTAELICMHGLHELDDETYAEVMSESDRLDYEIWMMQIGGEVWRRLLSVSPRQVKPAEMLMHLARLEPEDLEEVMVAVVHEPERGRELMQGVCGCPVVAA